MRFWCEIAEETEGPRFGNDESGITDGTLVVCGRGILHSEQEGLWAHFANIKVQLHQNDLQVDLGRRHIR